ncbi:MAG: S8 family serine peptidase [archaeon]
MAGIRSLLLFAGFALFVSFAILASPAFCAKKPGLSQNVASMSEHSGGIDVLLTLSNASQDELDALAELVPVKTISRFRETNTTIVSARLDSRAKLSAILDAFPAGLRSLDSIEEVREVRAHLDVSRGLVGISGGLSSYSLKGLKRTAIAIIDTGLDADHPDVNLTRLNWSYPNPLPWHDFVYDELLPYDDNIDDEDPDIVIGHGTHVSGIAFGAGLLNSSLSGVAPNSSFASLKVLNEFGSGSTPDIVDAMTWVEDNKEAYNITVASMSLGLSSPGVIDTALDNAANSLVGAGVVVVCSAGNKGPTGKMSSPATAQKCISVVALSDSAQLTSYSSIGNATRQPDIAAPGGSIISGSKINSTMSNSTGLADNNYHELAGTSMAAPHVAGAAQLVIQAMDSAGEPWNYTEAQALKVKMLLLMTATETNKTRESGGYNPVLNRGDPDNYEGYGQMNIEGAVDSAIYNLSVNSPANVSFENATNGTKVFARKVFLESGRAFNAFLNVSAGTDADIFLYSGTPDQYGRPVILNKSVSAGFGGNESFFYVPDANQTAYLVAKLVSGSSGNQTVSTSFPSIDAVAGNLVVPGETFYPGGLLWAEIETALGNGTLANATVISLQQGSCIGAYSTTYLSEGRYNLTANISGYLGNCTLSFSGTRDAEFFQSGNYTIQVDLLSMNSSSEMQRNLWEQANLSFYAPSPGVNLTVTNSTGGNVSYSEVSPGQYVSEVFCGANGTFQYNATATYGAANDSENFTLHCFEPFNLSVSAGNSSVWMNENLTVLANLTSTGLNLSEGNATCNGTIIGEAFANLANVSISEGEVLGLDLPEWNATNSANGTHNVSIQCKYLNYTSAANASFSILPAFRTNFTLSENTSVEARRPGGILLAGVSGNMTDLFFTEQFSFQGLLSGLLHFNLSSENTSLSLLGLDSFLVEPTVNYPNGSVPISSVFVNTSLVFPGAPGSYSIVFLNNSTSPVAYCPGNCSENFTEVSQNSQISFELPATFSIFERANLTLQNLSVSTPVTSAGRIYASGILALDYWNGTLSPVSAPIAWSLSSSGASGTVNSNSTGHFAFEFAPPLAGTYTFGISSQGYGVANNFSAERTVTVTPTCGNGHCETGESCCGDCGGCQSSSGGGGGFLPPEPTTTTTIEDSEPKIELPQTTEIPGANESNSATVENGFLVLSKTAESFTAEIFPTGETEGNPEGKLIEITEPIKDFSLQRVSFAVPAASGRRDNQTGKKFKISKIPAENISLLKILPYAGFAVTGAPETTGNITFNFSVETEWLARTSAEPSEIVLLRKLDNSSDWQLIVPESLGGNGTHQFYSAESPGFSTFVIAVTDLNSRIRFGEPEESSFSPGKMASLVVLIAFVFSVVFYYLTIRRAKKSSASPRDELVSKLRARLAGWKKKGYI